jgi:hypothetical protein
MVTLPEFFNFEFVTVGASRAYSREVRMTHFVDAFTFLETTNTASHGTMPTLYPLLLPQQQQQQQQQHYGGPVGAT